MLLMILLILAYSLGSISSAVLVSKLLGLPDPREQGSKNAGATNVLRLGGKKAAFFTLLGDLLKGFIPVGLAHRLELPPLALGLILIAAVLGHLFPLFFNFKGGKGVATTLGGLLALSFPVGVLSVGTWILVAGISRYSSLASLSAMILMPVYALWWLPQSGLPLACLALIVMIKHHDNLHRLWTKTEHKIGL